MDRQEHLQWCKDRAIQLLESGDLNGAFASMCSDVAKHNDTAGHVDTTNMLGMQLLLGGHLDTEEKMRDWILGYN